MTGRVRQLRPDCCAGRTVATHQWHQILKALAEYRAGRFRSALKTLLQVQRPRFETLVAIIRSMAHHKLGQTKQARHALQQALDLIHKPILKGDFGPDWWRWMYCHVLIREAETMIHGKSQK